MKRSAPVENDERKDDKRRKEDEEEEEEQLQVRRFGGKPDKTEEDDPDLAPEGVSDTEPERKWTSDLHAVHCEYDALEVPSLAIEDFAGRYEIEYLESGAFNERWPIQRDRAYVQISKTGEGRFYVDRTLSGYFSLERIEKPERGDKHVVVHWRNSLMSCEDRKRRERKLREKDGDLRDDEDDDDSNNPKVVHAGSIFFWADGRKANPSSKDQLRVMLLLPEYDGGHQFVLRRVLTGDGDPIVRVAKRARQERSIDGDDDWVEPDDDEDDDDDDDDDDDFREEEEEPPRRAAAHDKHEDEDDDDDDDDGIVGLRKAERREAEVKVVRRSAPGTDDLAPEGESDGEPNWDGPPADIDWDSVHDPSLAIADFAGRYEVMHIEAGMDGDSKEINKKRAYVEITPAGEGKFYLDKSVNGYFSLERIVHDTKAKKTSSQADVHWTKGKFMRAWQKERGHLYEEGEDGEDTATHAGDIFFTDESKQNVTLMLREEGEYEDGLAIALRKLA